MRAQDTDNMRRHLLLNLSQYSGVLVGSSAILLALISVLTEMPVIDIFAWLERYFSFGFIVMFSALLSLNILAIIRVKQNIATTYWAEVGNQSANGISTLALTFTLLGISLGIGSLSEQTLSPDTIQDIISSLTEQFSMAFMTTVVGLPSAAILRAVLAILLSRGAIE